MDETTLHVPPLFLRRAGFGDEGEVIEYGAWGIDHMCRQLGLDDLGSTELLDVGCGISFTKAFLDQSLPIRRYVGIDVNRELIELLRREVDDPRFEYHCIDARNEMYNPDGQPLSETAELPVGRHRFDLICLFSVFTHLAPHDYVSMLQVLRKHVKPDGRLFYSLYVDEQTEGGHGLMDVLARATGDQVAGRIDTFQDLNPEKELDWAVYSERYARELIEGTGWTPLGLHQPDLHIQHQFVCAPVPDDAEPRLPR